MKKLICILLVLMTVLNVAGCNRSVPVESVAFYYPRSIFNYYTEDAVIAAEERRAENFTAEELLSLYLLGPETIESLTNPFPANTKILLFELQDTVLKVVLSNEFAQLEGIALHLACACLGKTSMALTDAQTVEISCVTALLDGKSIITVDASTFLLYDGASSAGDIEE